MLVDENPFALSQCLILIYLKLRNINSSQLTLDLGVNNVQIQVK